MAEPTSRAELKDYCLRKLGFPVLEVNVDDDQIEDSIDDALQYYRMRHYDGVELAYMKHIFTADDISRFKSQNTTTTVGTAPNTTEWKTKDKYIDLPADVVGVTKVFGLASNAVRNNLFGIEYQIFLNDLYAVGSLDFLNYYMVKTWMETMDMVLNNGAFVQYRFNMRQDRLYLDVGEDMMNENVHVIVECHRAIDPETFGQVYSDIFLKKYTTALIKKQWGQNLIKFNGVTLPGGVSINGMQIYKEAEKELDEIVESSASTYELPPFDMIG